MLLTLLMLSWKTMMNFDYNYFLKIQNIRFKYWKHKTFKCTKNYEKPLAACRQYTVCDRHWNAFLNWFCYVGSLTLQSKTLFLTWLQNMCMALRLQIYCVYIYIYIYIYTGWTQKHSLISSSFKIKTYWNIFINMGLQIH